MVAPYVSDLERLISSPRLERYRPNDRDDLETAVTYLWNAALSEALLQGIAAVEVALRNALHRTFTAHVGTEYWFQAVLRPDEMRSVHETWTKLHKRHGRPPTAGKIVADLMFGFWPPLFSDAYHDLWFENHAAHFKAVFPNLPSKLPPHQAITRKVVHERVESIHKLRNRVGHHEPIWFGLTMLNKPTIPLEDIHRHMVELLDWIDPNLSLTLSFVDRFDDVHHREKARIELRLKDHFQLP